MIFLLLTFDTEAERQTFEYIYSRYKKLLLHKAFGILHDYALAEDAVSEGFLRIYKNLHKVDDPNSPRAAAFFVTIVKNVALTMLQRKKRDVVDFADWAEETLPSTVDVEEDVLAALSEKELYAIVDCLNEEAKSVFLLKYAYDLSHREIGRLLSISENNVTVRLHRAKKKLADILKERGMHA